MNAEFAVRRAELQDVAGIMAIAAASTEAPQWSESVYRDIVRDGVENATPARRTMFVMVMEDGRVIGFAVGAVVLEEAELESIVVDACVRRGGVGSGLCEAVAVWAAGLGARTIRLEVRATNAAAQAMYRKAGFEQAGLRRGYYAAPVDDAVMMAKVLRPYDL